MKSHTHNLSPECRIRLITPGTSGKFAGSSVDFSSTTVNLNNGQLLRGKFPFKGLIIYVTHVPHLGEALVLCGKGLKGVDGALEGD